MKASREETAADLAKLKKMLARARGVTPADAVAELKINRRTFYRWLDKLQADGVKVQRAGMGRPTIYVTPGASPR